MTQNPYEHAMIFVEENPEGDGASVQAIAVDLDPNTPATMRQLSKEEFGEDMNAYIGKVRSDMDKLVDQLADQVVTAAREKDLRPHYGLVDLVDMFEKAPHLLLANVIATLISGIGQQIIEEENSGTSDNSEWIKTHGEEEPIASIPTE